jgi:predicted NBD/HSP70 family sugar kinase
MAAPVDLHLPVFALPSVRRPQQRMSIPKSAYNQLLVRAILFHRGPASRIELGQITGIPLSVLTETCGSLMAQGLIRETHRASPSGNGRGRRRAVLEICGEQLGVGCIQYDRHAIDAAIVNLTGALCWHQHWDGPFDADRLRERLPRCVKAMIKASPFGAGRLLAIGAADPGVVDRSRGRALQASNLDGWTDVPVAEILGEATDLPIAVERGDGLQAMGEATFGAGRGISNALYVTMVDDGIGGGVIEHGRLMTGRNGAAGEIGHMHAGGDALCGCGLRGCLEAQIKAERLIAEYRSRLAGACPSTIALPDVIAAARDGSVIARGIFTSAAEKLAQVVGSAINLLNPEAVILGGHFVTMGDLIVTPLRAALPRFAMRETARDVTIRLAELGRSAAFVGTAAQVRAALFAYPSGNEVSP